MKVLYLFGQFVQVKGCIPKGQSKVSVGDSGTEIYMVRAQQLRITNATIDTKSILFISFRVFVGIPAKGLIRSFAGYDNFFRDGEYCFHSL